MEKRELHSVLTDFLNERLIQVTASGQAEKNDFLKAKIRPVLAKGALHFQAEEFIGKQAFHKNLTAEEAVDYLEGLMETSFRQLQLEAQDKSGTVLVGLTQLLRLRGLAVFPITGRNGISWKRESRFRSLWNLVSRRRTGQSSTQSTINSARSTGSWNLLRTCFQSLIRRRRPGSLILAVESLI